MSRFEDITDEIEGAGLYSQILASRQFLHKQHPEGVDLDAIGVHAWNELDAEQRQSDLPHVLGSYARRILDEQAMKCMDVAARDKTRTYIDDFDVPILWEDLYPVLGQLGKDAPDVRVPVNSGSLANVLSELSLLQHRLAMRDAEAKPASE